MATEVPVWLGGERVGEISARTATSVRFRYDQSVLDRYPLNTPLLSCSLPTSMATVDARAFFAGLLPEGDHRRALASRAGVLDTHVVALLRRYGQDVAGAVVVGDSVARHPHASVEPYSSESLQLEVVELSTRARPLGVHDDSELSLPGLQDKMLLVELGGGSWGRPVHGYPSTHILKLDDRTHRGLVAAEHACLQLAGAAGLPAARSELARIADADCLIVERYDRRLGTDGTIQRIHQEDACQALGVDLERSQGRAKYEQHGGPALMQVAGLLNAWGSPEDLLLLLDQVVFTVLIGNADAHGKNMSLLHEEPTRVRLAPLYDTVPTALWPSLRTRAAMSVGGAVDLPRIDVADVIREATRWGLRPQLVHDRALDCIDRVAAACARIDPGDEPTAERALALVADRCRAMREGVV